MNELYQKVKAPVQQWPQNPVALTEETRQERLNKVLFLSPDAGVRVQNNANEIAYFEYGAVLASFFKFIRAPRLLDTNCLYRRLAKFSKMV